MEFVVFDLFLEILQVPIKKGSRRRRESRGWQAMQLILQRRDLAGGVQNPPWFLKHFVEQRAAWRLLHYHRRAPEPIGALLNRDRLRHRVALRQKQALHFEFVTKSGQTLRRAVDT